MKTKNIYLLLIICVGLFINTTSYAQKKKHCFVYIDETKIEQTDSSFSKSVVSNIVKVKVGDNWKVKKEFYKKWQIEYPKVAIDTSKIEMIWVESKSEAKKKQKEIISELNRNSSQKVMIFRFEFEYEFSFEFKF